MDFEQYGKEAYSLKVYPVEYCDIYPVLKLAGEAGEVAEKVGKYLRDSTEYSKLREDILKELGDVLWYVNAIAIEYGWTLDMIAKANLAKLHSRKDRGVLHGSGDNR